MQTGCENDFFDAVLFLEDSLVEKGRQVARKDVVKKAVSEGYELGYQKVILCWSSQEKMPCNEVPTLE